MQRTLHRVRIGAAAALLLWCVAVVAATIPVLSAPVTDATGTLSQPQITALRAKIDALEQRKGSQLVILLVPTVAPDSVEDFAVRTFETNAIGRKGVDDGLLLLVAKDDRKVRIEVGYGLEGAIPDVLANRIIGEYLTPKFREGDIPGGLDAAVDAMAALIDGEPLPAPLVDDSGTKAPANSWFPVSVFIGVMFGQFAVALRRPSVGPAIVAGGLAAGLAGMIFSLLAAAGVAAAAGFIAGMIKGGSSGGYASGRGGSGGWSGGGWSGGSSGGGWSGGGGRSGGGGASGSW